MLPISITYLFKLSLGLAAVYLFYRLVLQNLTFYIWNRLYFIICTAFAFIIPLVDVSVWLNPQPKTFIVNYIPPVEKIALGNFSAAPVKIEAPSGIDYWEGVLIILAAGSVLLSLKTLIQFISFLNIKKRARLISDGEIKIYEVAGDIIPFSFSRSIFLNTAVKQETDLQEIIRHELVHVRQYHTADILWLELVCILNWYNPFAWLLRHHVRQNLEFIADNNVLQTGTDKKHYQYLLLQILGEPAFRLAHQFNFSPLKKRILMMNKKPSTRSHLIKFSLLLPLVAILLVSFRSIEKSTEGLRSTNFGQQDFDPRKDVPHIVGREYPKEGTAIFIFNNGSKVTYDLTTESGIKAYADAQNFLGGTYYPNNPDRQYDPQFKEFMNRNPEIKEVSWRYDLEALKSINLENLDDNFISLADRMYFTLTSGKKEVYRLETKEDLALVEKKYGKLPMVPMAPPKFTYKKPVGSN